LSAEKNKRFSTIQNPIDAFIWQKLAEHGLPPPPEANRRTLIRRLSFDLIGLPPAPAEIERFLADRTAFAYPKLVDRLLESPHFGERWGRHWLDAGRLSLNRACSSGPDPARLLALPRYVIRAFNADKPFNRFIMEQIAGDDCSIGVQLRHLLRTNDILAATGFLRCPPDATDNQPITQQEKIYPAQQLAMEVSMKAVMGLSLNCVRCHSHKYDPFHTKITTG